MIESDRATIEKLIEYVAAVENPLLGAASATVQTLVLALPVVGVIVILWQLARAGTRLARRHLPTLTTHLRAGLPSLARLIPVRPARRAATAGRSTPRDHPESTAAAQQFARTDRRLAGTVQHRRTADSVLEQWRHGRRQRRLRHAPALLLAGDHPADHRTVHHRRTRAH